jgi:hypothetical protein
MGLTGAWPAGLIGMSVSIVPETKQAIISSYGQAVARGERL